MTEIGELTFTRVHHASPEFLFDCMTTPEHLARFWGPVGTSTPLDGIVVDLRPGGVFETTMVNDADGQSYTMRAVYAEVRRPDRLVWIEPGVEGGMRTTITFVDLHDGRTEVVTHQTNVPERYRSAAAVAGLETSFDRFGRYVAARTVTSADGTTIGYDRVGGGPALILVDGAMCYRAAGPMRPLAELLRSSFTVYTYDRRGRGDSSDTIPYEVSREIEDLRALIERAGGHAFVYGLSSGAALAIAAAAVTPGIDKLALYEPPFLAEVEDGTRAKEYGRQLGELLDAGRPGDAVAWFMTYVGVPEPVVTGMRGGPGWATLEAIAPTLAYDNAILGDSRAPRVDLGVPSLVLAGGASPAGLRGAARAAADALPGAVFRTLAGQTHDVAPQALAPVLIDFFRP